MFLLKSILRKARAGRIFAACCPIFMPTPSPTVQFENAAGQILAHPAGYAILRYRTGKRQPTDIADLLTNLGRVLLRHNWYRFLADNREMSPLNEAEKAWFTTHWLGQRVPRPAPLWAAIVVPTEVVARLSIAQMTSQANPASIIYRTFTEPGPAENYLLALPAPRL